MEYPPNIVVLLSLVLIRLITKILFLQTIFKFNDGVDVARFFASSVIETIKRRGLSINYYKHELSV